MSDTVNSPVLSTRETTLTIPTTDQTVYIQFGPEMNQTITEDGHILSTTLHNGRTPDEIPAYAGQDDLEVDVDDETIILHTEDDAALLGLLDRPTSLLDQWRQADVPPLDIMSAESDELDDLLGFNDEDLDAYLDNV